MDKVTAPHIEQQLRLNRSVGSGKTGKSLFYLYLSMLEKDVTGVPRFVDNGSTDEIVYADIESHYYRHPSLQFSEQDFSINRVFSQAVNSQANQTLQLLNAMFPQGLSEKNNHLSIADEVIDGLDFYARQRINNTLVNRGLNQGDLPDNVNTIDVDETMLYDLIPQASQFLT